MTLDSQMLLMTFNFLLFFSADAFVFFGKQKGCNLDGEEDYKIKYPTWTACGYNYSENSK